MYMSEIRLMLKKRKEYLLFILTAFAVGFLIYIILAYCGIKYGNFNSPVSPAIYGIMGGYLFASIVSGIILFVRFIKNKPAWVKIICIVLFLFVFVVVYFIGTITLVSYFFYNVICFIADTNKVKRLEKGKVKSVLKGTAIEQLMEKEIEMADYEEIKDNLKLYNKLNGKIAGITGSLIGGGLILLFIQDGLLQSFAAFIIIAVGAAFLEEKRIYAYMHKEDHYSVGMLYIGYDEEFFGIFHEGSGLVRKPLGKYRILEGVKLNEVNKCIVNNDRNVTIIYGR